MQLNPLAVSMLNLLVCGGIFFICFCRVIATDGRVLLRVRVKFCLIGGTAMWVGVSPMWGSYAGMEILSFTSSVAVGLLAETFQWRHGPPASVRVDTMPASLRRDL